MTEAYENFQEGRRRLAAGLTAQATVALEKAKKAEPEKASIRSPYLSGGSGGGSRRPAIAWPGDRANRAMSPGPNTVSAAATIAGRPLRPRLTASAEPSGRGCFTNRKRSGNPSISRSTCSARCPVTTVTSSIPAAFSSQRSVTITGRPSIGRTGFA